MGYKAPWFLICFVVGGVFVVVGGGVVGGVVAVVAVVVAVAVAVIGVWRGALS